MNIYWAGKTRAAAVSSILSAKTEDGTSMLEAAYNSSVNSAGAADEAMETAMNSIESKIALFTQATQTMWQNAISSDFIKWVVDAGTAVMKFVDNFGLFKTAIASVGFGLLIGNFKNIKAYVSEMSVAFTTLQAKVAAGTVVTSDYQAALGGLSVAQQKAILSSLGLSEAEQAEILSNIAATTTIKAVNRARIEEALAAKLGSKEKAESVIKTLQEAGALKIEEEQLKDVNREKIIAAIESGALSKEEGKAALAALGFSGANGVLAASFKALKTEILLAGKALKALFATPLGWVLAAAAALTIVVGVLDKVYVSYDEHKEKLKDLQQEYEDAKTEVDSLTSQLDELGKKIDEIESKGTLTLTDKADLANMQAQTKELAAQLAIAQEKERIAKDNADREAKATLNSTFESEYIPHGQNASGMASQVTSRKELGLAIEKIKEYKAAYDDAVETVNKYSEMEANGTELTKKQSKEYEKAKKSMGEYDKSLSDAREYANGLAEDLSTQYESLDQTSESGKELADEISSLTSEYNLLTDQLNGTTTYFNALSDEEKRAALVAKMTEAGIKDSASEIEAFVDGLSSENLSVLYVMKMDEETSIADLEEGIANMQKKADETPVVITTTNDNAAKASEVKNFITTQKATVNGSEKTLDSIFSDYESEIDSLSEYLSKAINNSLTGDELRSLGLEFGIVAKNSAEAEQQIRDVMYAAKSSTIQALDEAIRQLDEDTQGDLINSLEQLKERLRDVNTEAQALASDTSGYISSMSNMASGFDALDKIYADVKNGKGKNKSSENNGAYFDFSSLVDSTFVEQFQECGDAYQDFLDIVASSPDDIDACQSAFDNLATEYVIQKAGLDKLVDSQGNVNEALKATTIAQLENNGVTNASAFVNEYLAQKVSEVVTQKWAQENVDRACVAAARDFVTGNNNATNSLLTEIGATEAQRTALYELIVQEQVFNDQNLSVEDKIKKLESLTGAYYGAAAAADLAARMETLNRAGAVNDNTLADAVAGIQDRYSNISITVPTIKYGGGQSSNKSGSSSSSSAATTTKTTEYINWTENAIDNIQEKIDRLNDTINDLTPYNKKINTLKEIYSWERKLVDMEKKDVTQTKKQYEKQLSKLSKGDQKKYKKLIESMNAVSYETFVSSSTTGENKGKTVDKENKTLYDTVSNAQKAWQEYQDALGNYTKDKADLLQVKLDVYEAEIEHLEGKIDIYEARVDRAQQMIDSLSNEDITKDIARTLEIQAKKGKKTSSNKEVKALAEKYGVSVDRYLEIINSKKDEAYKTGLLLGAYQKKQYDIEFKNYEKSAKAAEDKAAKLREEIKLVNKTSEKYAELCAQIADADAEAKKAREDAQEAYKNELMAKFNSIDEAYGNASEKRQSEADAVQAKIDYNNTNGKDNEAKDYQKVIDLRKEDAEQELNRLNELKKRREDIAKNMAKLDKNDVDYNDKYAAAQAALEEADKVINETAESYYDLEQAAKDAQKQMLEAPLTGLQKQLDLINDQIAAVEKLKNKYSDMIGVVTWYLGEQISNLEDQKNNISDYYDELIEPLETELENLQKVNEERDRALAIEKAQWALSKAMNQKSVKTLRNGEWVACAPFYSNVD